MRKTLDFLLHDWIGVHQLLPRPRFAEHSLETFASVLDTCERIAREKFAPFNRLGDTQEPRCRSAQRVHLPEATHAALAAYVESGMLAAAQDHDVGGMQLPCVIEMAANAFFHKASVAHGRLRAADQRQRQPADGPRHAGAARGLRAAVHSPAGGSAPCACPSRRRARASATWPRAPCRTATISKPTRSARATGCKGNKMWISAGEHEITENIVHLVLAKIPRPMAAGAGHQGHLAVRRAEAAASMPMAR